jgi:YidC/Oxa1 family membrane protein insertase
MAEFFGAIQQALGAALNAIYTVIPSYGVAIILLTIAVRAVLIPLTLKQIRSMTAMQTLAPELKKIQQKYKQMQQKVNDRQELMQIRQKMQQEMSALYKEHGVNPASGCLPLIAQMPAFIALYSVLRTSIVVIPLVVTLPGGQPVPSDYLPLTNLRGIVCVPEQAPTATGPNPTLIDCPVKTGNEVVTKPVSIAGDFVDSHKYPAQKLAIPNTSWVTHCLPFKDISSDPAGKLNFHCLSALGTGHLPKNGKLFKALTEDRAVFLGMHLACTAPQAASKDRIVECTRKKSDGGGAHSVPYYLLIALVIGTTYYQSRQMSQRVAASGQPVPQQQQMMTRIMPVFFGLISLNFPAGLNLYFFATNLWTIGQQALVYRAQDAKNPPAPGGKPKPAPQAQAKKLVADEPAATVTPPAPAARPQGSRKRKKRKKRR